MAKERFPRETYDRRKDQDLTVDVSVEGEHCSASY